MAKKVNADICAARAEVYRELADHLELEWTNCPLERSEGKRIQDLMRKEEMKWRELESDRS